MITEVRLQIYGPRTDRTTSGNARIESWDKRARLQRALKIWGLCWGIAIAAIPFPLIHFVVLPTMLLSGPFAALYVYTRKSVILGGEGECPDCGERLRIARLSHRFPQSDLCESCQSSVKLELA
jgi:hypothetical protein